KKRTSCSSFTRTRAPAASPAKSPRWSAKARLRISTGRSRASPRSIRPRPIRRPSKNIFFRMLQKLLRPRANWPDTDLSESGCCALGKTKGLNIAEFDVGAEVRVADRGFLEKVLEAGQYHNELEPEQLAFAGAVARVKSVEFFHGGDEIYTLEGVPGVWHEECLSAA